MGDRQRGWTLRIKVRWRLSNCRARLEQSWKPPHLNRGIVEGQRPQLLQESGLGGRHSRKLVTHIHGIAAPRDARCCQSVAKQQHARHAFASLTTSSSSLLLSVAAGVLTLVPTSLSNLGIENTTYPKKGAPTPRLSSYSEPGKLFLAHKLTFFPFWPRSCRLGFHDILMEEIHRRARMRLHRAVTVSGLWLIQAGRTRACVSCLGSRGQVKVGRTKPVLSEVLRKSVPHFISCNLSTVTGQTVCLEQFPNFWTHILDHLVPVARALVFQEN